MKKEDDNTMPEVRWRWDFSPQTIISLLNFVVILVGVVGLFFKMQSDVSAAREAVSELKSAFSTLTSTQVAGVERLVKVETKVDLMLPALSRIETNQRQPPQPQPR